MRCILVIGALWVVLLAAPLAAAVEDLRISEVRPDTDEVEVYNSGGAFTQAADAFFCYATIYHTIPSGTDWTAGEYKTFTVGGGGLNDSLSDVWLYRSNNFTQSSELVHGVKYGGNTLVGRETVAVAAGVWPSSSAFVPAPGAGQTLAWDLFGFTTYDWYVDATPSLGAADSTTAGGVGDTLAWPSGASTFENVSLGDDITAIQNWVLVDTGANVGEYTVRSVADTATTTGSRPAGTTRWLRIRDANVADQNRFYTPTINAAAGIGSYTWTWYVNLEQPISAAAAVKPKFTIQHDNTGFFNAWGIELTDTNFNLVVLGAGATPAGIGGTDATTAITPILTAQWVRLDLTVNFIANTVSGRVNGGAAATLPVSLTGDEQVYRFCYRGEGVGNGATFLLDDISMSGSIGEPPAISVNANSLPVSNGGTVNVAAGAALASLALDIDITDNDAASSVSLAGTVGNVTTQGILNAEFSSALVADPYSLAPSSGTFNVQSVNHLVTLTATDNDGNQAVFTFTIAVAASVAPVVTVTRNSAPVANTGTFNVLLGSTLAALVLEIDVADNDPGSSVSLAGTVSNVATQGILDAEFTSASAADPYTLTPATGTFDTLVAHLVTLTATDNFGLTSNFTFTINVTTNTAPTIGVTRGGTPVANAGSITVNVGTTLASLAISIAVGDADSGNSVTLVGSVTNVTSQGILNSQFSAPAAAAPYNVNPVSGTFTIPTSHVVTLVATDNNSLTANFSFTINVVNPPGTLSGGGGGGGCGAGASAGFAGPLALLGLWAWRRRRNEPGACRR